MMSASEKITAKSTFQLRVLIIFKQAKSTDKNFFDDFTFTPDLEFIFHIKKSVDIFQCPLFLLLKRNFEKCCYFVIFEYSLFCRIMEMSPLLIRRLQKMFTNLSGIFEIKIQWQINFNDFFYFVIFFRDISHFLSVFRSHLFAADFHNFFLCGLFPC